MATVTPVVRSIAHGIVSVIWDFAGADTCLPIRLPQYPDKALTVIAGTIGTSVLVLQGNNDIDVNGNPVAASWQTLHRPAGTGLSYTTNGVDQVLEDPVWIRPDPTAGTGTGHRMALTLRRNIPFP